MEKLKIVAQALLLCAVGCSPHTDHGGGFNLSGSSGGDDMSLGSGGDTDMSGPLTIAPLAQVLTITPGMMPTVQFTATVDGMSVSPAWTIDRGELGTVGVSSGLFTAAGTLGGTATITATYLQETASTTVTIKLSQMQNGDPGYPAPPPGAGGYGGVGGAGPSPPASTGQTGVLGGTPILDGNVKLLYPYDGTVWPRGLLAPLIQWAPATRNFDAVLVKLHSNNYDYTGTFAANASPFINMPIPADVWHTLTYSNDGKGDDITVSLVFEDISGTATAIGPYTMTWHVAPGTLKGTVYYNSYGTTLVANSGQKSCGPADTGCNENRGDMTGPYFGAATLAIQPGTTDPVVAAGTTTPPTGATGSLTTGCRVCHAVSANGSTLFTQQGNSASYKTSSSYTLTAMGNTEVPVTPAVNVAYPALSPDGSFFMSSVGTIAGDTTTQAYSTAGVLASPQPSLGNTTWAKFGAGFPSFSPDGKHLVFNYQSSTVGTTTTTDGKSLGVLTYDPTQKVFNNFVKLNTPAAGVASWSSFLPTNDAVIFENELASPAGFGFTRYNNTGSLWWVDLATQTAHSLDNLNGKGYLPTSTSHTDDTTVNYEPTVNPVVSGGYAWVVFTSRRLYGNVAVLPPWTSDPRNYDWTEPNKIDPATMKPQTVTTKKLWVAAIDLNASPGTDPSHPAFYLPAQEIQAGNARGYWTVNPCLADGNGCETGDECCGGYCRPSGDMGLICTNQQPSCSQEFEKCTTTADCCGAAAGITCINGFCSKSTPIP